MDVEREEEDGDGFDLDEAFGPAKTGFSFGGLLAGRQGGQADESQGSNSTTRTVTQRLKRAFEEEQEEAKDEDDQEMAPTDVEDEETTSLVRLTTTAAARPTDLRGSLAEQARTQWAEEIKMRAFKGRAGWTGDESQGSNSTTRTVTQRLKRAFEEEQEEAKDEDDQEMAPTDVEDEGDDQPGPLGASLRGAGGGTGGPQVCGRLGQTQSLPRARFESMVDF
ncbi:hypothetical protein Rt10032_c16g5583 [Rhodotorula toruloides]|uniref:Uncharacterized protein n=1 Tax=Rhodotorula toruloides TaxID=5286 RepID=A0A511KNY4_RHOTO|nr:hypothetical protein Rt10032_c16g5583 [Rhodotorula toruloides]